MYWNGPPIIKVYEALGCLADGRISLNGENEAQVSSSSGNKKYIVKYDPYKNSIIANDNGSYWQGYLGYPSIAFLMVKGVISFDKNLSQSLGGIAWKAVNTKFKNDFAETENYVLDLLSRKKLSPTSVQEKIKIILNEVNVLKLGILEPKIKPPTGY